MSGVFQIAPSGRARCRGCGTSIAKDTVRFGELVPNPYGEGEAALWFHPLCAALRRPDPVLQSLDDPLAPADQRDELARFARAGLAYRRLPRLSGAERAPTGRARCRSCKEMIPKGGWRFSLVWFEQGRFEPSGFVHVRCARDYFETTDLTDRLPHLVELTPDELAEIVLEMRQ